MKQRLRFVWRYKLHILVTLAIALAGICDATGHKEIAHWTLGLVLLAALIPLGNATWTSFRHGQYELFLLPSVALLFCVWTGQYWAGVVLLAVVLLIRRMRQRAENRAAKLNPLFNHTPSSVLILRGSKRLKTALSQVHTGDKIVITQDSIIPIDSVVLTGTATLDCHVLTGDIAPRTLREGDFVAAGSVNRGEEFIAKAAGSADASQLNKLEKLLRGARHSQSPFSRHAERFSLMYSLVVLIAAATMWYITGDNVRFLQISITATIVPLVAVAPLIDHIALGRLSRWGVYVRSAAALQQLAQLQTLILSKTGTVTTAQPTVKTITTFNGYKQADVLAAASALEQSSQHPFAKAILEAARVRKIGAVKAKHVRTVTGHGLSAQFKGKPVLVGRLDLLWDNNVALPPAFKSSSIAGPSACVAIDGVLAGIILFEDAVRSEAKRTLEGLRSLGINLMLVTGDNLPAARQTAKALGLKNFSANALPTHKLQLLEGIEKRPAAYVGDCTTDGAVLTTADIGIGFATYGPNALGDTADVILPGDDLVNLYKAARLSRRAHKLAKRAIALSLVISAATLVAFGSGLIAPIFGALVQGAVAILAIVYAQRTQRLHV